MKILYIDTSSAGLFIGLTNDEKYSETYIADCKTTHSQILMPELDKLLKKENVGISDIDYFAVTVGPGSFTGLRIGACTVKGFMLGGKAKAVCCNTLEAVAYNYLGENKKVLVINDAKHGNAFCGLFNAKDHLETIEMGFYNEEGIERLKKEADISVSEFENAYNVEVRKCQKDGFVKLAKDKIAKGELSDENFEILYLKRSQAEEEYGI